MTRIKRNYFTWTPPILLYSRLVHNHQQPQTKNKLLSNVHWMNCCCWCCVRMHVQWSETNTHTLTHTTYSKSLASAFSFLSQQSTQSRNNAHGSLRHPMYQDTHRFCKWLKFLLVSFLCTSSNIDKGERKIKISVSWCAIIFSFSFLYVWVGACWTVFLLIWLLWLCVGNAISLAAKPMKIGTIGWRKLCTHTHTMRKHIIWWLLIIMSIFISVCAHSVSLNAAVGSLTAPKVGIWKLRAWSGCEYVCNFVLHFVKCPF